MKNIIENIFSHIKAISRYLSIYPLKQSEGMRIYDFNKMCKKKDEYISEKNE